MKEYGVECQYNNENDYLAESNANQFNGSRIYDDNEYLTSLLIESHLISASFKESCQSVFAYVIPNMLSNDANINNILVDKLGNYCIRYTKGNVKRCIVKSKIRL